MIAEGTVAFESLKEHDVFNGQSTGKFTLTLTLDEKSATNLESEGVKIKDYEGKPQRKFSTQYTVPVFDLEGKPFMGQVTRGSKVRVQWKKGNPHPVHGTPPYLEKVRVLELAEAQGSTDEDF
jgi:hypothetical protein